MPPIFGKAIAWSSLGTWLVGMAVIVGAAWFGSRAAVALALFPITLDPGGASRQGDKLWEQTFQRRYFLLGALPVVSFGMMLAHFVGINSPDIMNPRIGSITAVLRNNYWLTIHVLTIVSSYGAGGLAWGLGNLAMLFYLFGKYRPEGHSASRRPPRPPFAAPRSGQRRPDLRSRRRFTAARNRRSPRRLKKAGKALKPTMLPADDQGRLRGLRHAATSISSRPRCARPKRRPRWRATPTRPSRWPCCSWRPARFWAACGPTSRGAASGTGIRKKSGP